MHLRGTITVSLHMDRQDLGNRTLWSVRYNLVYGGHCLTYALQMGYGEEYGVIPKICQHMFERMYAPFGPYIRYSGTNPITERKRRRTQI